MNTRYTITQLTEPTEEPVSVSELKQFLRLSHDHENQTLNGLLRAARMFCENYTGKAFIVRDFQACIKIGRENTALHVPKMPLQAVTDVDVLDEHQNILRSLTPEEFSVDLTAATLRLKVNKVSFAAEPFLGVRFTAGFGNAEDVPESIKQAILMKATYLYEDRGDAKGMTAPFDMIAALLKPYKKISVV